MSPRNVPTASYDGESHKHYRCVVHRRGCDWYDSRHTEERNSQQGPSLNRGTGVSHKGTKAAKALFLGNGGRDGKNEFKPVQGEGEERTERNVIADETQLAEVKAGVLDSLALVQQAHGDGHGVRGCQANNAHTGEGVEGGAGAEVDQTEGDLHDHG